MLFFVFVGFVCGLSGWSSVVSLYCPPAPRLTSESSSAFYDHFDYRTTGTCRNENSKKFLTIAVLSSGERLFNYLPAILETWAMEATEDIEILIFLEENSTETDGFLEETFSRVNSNHQRRYSACLFIVRLKNVENDYPPQKKSFFAMKFLYMYYADRTSWILRLDDNAYVHSLSLLLWLKLIDHQRALYIGQGGTGRRQGPAIHFPPGQVRTSFVKSLSRFISLLQYFCMGGSGVILSQTALLKLGPRLDQCFQSELRTRHEDVELGRCILAHVGISCSKAYDSKHLFYHHYGPSYEFGYDFTPAIVSRALILHPVKNRTTFRHLYAFEQRKQLSKLQRSSQRVRQEKTYSTFLAAGEFNLAHNAHYQRIDGRLKTTLDEAVRRYIEQLQKLWHQSRSNWTVLNGQAIFGYHRVIFTDRFDLLIEILLQIRPTKGSSNQSVIVRKRLHLRRPFVPRSGLAFRELTIEANNDAYDRRLHLVVVSSNKDQALTRFLQNFRREILYNRPRRDLFTLTVLYFTPRNEVHALLRQFSVRYSSSIRLFTVNQSEHGYNRGLGRQLASKYFLADQLLFFLDVDLLFTRQALLNVHRLMIDRSKCTVFFPIVFSIFSTKFVTNKSSSIDVRTTTGLFSIYGFGNVALKKDDLTRLGGWELNNEDWGVEDVNLFERLSNSSAECLVFRAVEPGLRHYYHPKMCNTIKNDIRRQMCSEAEATLLGSQADMTRYIIERKIID